MEAIEKDPEVKKATTTRLNGTAKHWIDGEWVDAEQHGTSVDPATGESIGRYADGGRVEAEKAVAAALRAFEETSWRHNHALLSQVLLAMADLRGQERRSDPDAKCRKW